MSDNDQQILSSTSGMTVLPIRGTQELSLPFAVHNGGSHRLEQGPH